MIVRNTVEVLCTKYLNKNHDVESPSAREMDFSEWTDHRY